MRSILFTLFITSLAFSACSGEVSVGEVQVNGETVLEDYEASFGE